MAEREARFIDTYEFARLQRELRGETPISSFTRLIDGLPQQGERKVEWVLAGETDGFGQRFLRLQVQAVVTLECQRCLGFLDLPLRVESRIELVNTEAELEAEDTSNEDDPETPDRVLGSTHFDVLSLVEDELILALPYVPKHEVCPSLPKTLETAEGSDISRPSPFAVLAELKKD